jgi:hypothetical protein
MEYQGKIQSLQDNLLTVEQTKNELITKLRDDNAKLNTPMGKGESGEFAVEDTLRNSKFHVFDTSKSPHKEQGYLDRILTEDGMWPSSGWMIAIEVKNKKKLVRSTDMDAFKKKSEEGILSGKFHATILLSIDDSLPGNSNSIMEFVNDGNGVPVGPVAMYSPLLNTQTLTQEQVVLCVHQHIHVLKQCNIFRSILSQQAAKDEDIYLVQSFFANYVNSAKESFEEIGELNKTIQKFQLLVDRKRKSMFEQFKYAEEINKKISWLNTSFSIPLNIAFENAKAKQEMLKSATKSSVFTKIGNLPLLNAQLGVDNAWDMIKSLPHSITEVEESMEDAPNMEIVQDPEERLKEVSNMIYDHIKRKRETNTDYWLSSVTTGMIGQTIRDPVRQVGGIDVVKRFMRENREEWKDVIDDENQKKRSKKQKPDDEAGN